MRRMTHLRPLASIAAAALLAFPAGACRKEPERRVDPSAPRYTVRGEVVQVDDTASGRSLLVRHEAIPEFVDSSGARVGMQAMIMPFQVGRGVEGAEVKPGDRVRLKFAVDWKVHTMEVEEIERLPADTALVFEKKER
ncbi:MAG TPA: copper-binding protein [Anaeromyxobacter sp.]|nr:copper-binding protein [Anaeromyxobacter sp.]